MLELGVDITNPDSVLITRQAGDAPVEEQWFRRENYTLGRRRFTPQPELHIVRPGRLMDNPTRDRWKDLLKGDGLHPGTLQSDGRASWRSFPPLERDCEFNGSAGACYLPASPADWIDGDDQGDVEGRLVIASLDREIHQLGVLHGGVTLAGRYHDFQPLLGNAVEFEAGAAGKVRFRAGAAGAAPCGT